MARKNKTESRNLTENKVKKKSTARPNLLTTVVKEDAVIIFLSFFSITAKETHDNLLLFSHAHCLCNHDGSARCMTASRLMLRLLNQHLVQIRFINDFIWTLKQTCDSNMFY